MSRPITFYCSCSTCTQIRNEQPKHYRYINSIRSLFQCSCFSTKRKLMIENQPTFSRMSTITFRDIDITNKHCSKHDVMVKATRPHLSKIKNEELRQRVKEANQRWTHGIPLCTRCYENLSPTTFNLCYMCITTLINYYQQLTTSTSSLSQDRNTLAIHPYPNMFDSNDENPSEGIEQYFIDYFQHD